MRSYEAVKKKLWGSLKHELSLFTANLHYRVIDVYILSYQTKKQPPSKRGGAEKATSKSYLIPGASYSLGTMLNELRSIKILGKDTQHDMVLTLGSGDSHHVSKRGVAT